MSSEKSTDLPLIRTAQAGSLLSQWWTLGSIAADRRSKGHHLKVAWVILDRHMAKYGNAEASVRFIKRGIGLSAFFAENRKRETMPTTDPSKLPNANDPKVLGR